MQKPPTRKGKTKKRKPAHDGPDREHNMRYGPIIRVGEEFLNLILIND